ncbi:hypothetical protein G6F56_000766 [Rhizopus delemar]|nr:hypothetical protein G6F56_000766 [Rhizopus delemar]
MQSCEKQLNDGSLEGVNALSGCSVLLFDSQNLDELSSEEIIDACDILFYTINWFREILNSFINARGEDLSQTLILRLRNILELESNLDNCLKYVSTYAPIEFHNTLSISPKEDFPKSSQIIVTDISTNVSEESQSSIKPNTKKDSKPLNITFNSAIELRPYMRAFSLPVFEIFKYNNDKVRMTHVEMNYVLDDLNNKLNIKIVPVTVLPFGKKKATNENKTLSSNVTLLARMDSGKFMRQIVPSLPYILQILEELYVEIQEKNVDTGRIQGAEEIASAISHIVNVFYKLLSWPHIRNPDNKDILEAIIQSLAERISGESKKTRTSPEIQIQQAFQYLSHYGENMPQSVTAVLLFKTLLRLMELSDNHISLKQGASTVAAQIVSTSWFDWLDIKKQIEFLVEKMIELNDDPLQVLHELVNDVLPNFEREGALENHPLLKSDTAVQYYQAIINQIVKSFELFKNTDQDPEIILVRNGRVVKIFERITYYVKIKEQRLLIAVLLKTGKLFIDQFTKHSIPDLQASTRVLQIICSHVKVLKDVSLSAYVPPLKKSLETVIYQVKILVTRNGAPTSAFFMGALKHRDISGAEISSQILPDEDEDEEPVNEELVLSDVEEVAEEEESNDNENTYNSPSHGPTKKKESSKRKKTTHGSKPRKRSKQINIPTDINYRTSSQVPSSSEGEASEDELTEEGTISNLASENEGDDEKVLEFDLNSSNIDDDSEDGRLPSPAPPAIEEKRPEARKKRLGIGRPKPISRKKIFDLTGSQSE